MFVAISRQTPTDPSITLSPCRAAPSAGFFSHVLHWVRHERADREKEFRRQQLEARRQQRREKENSIVAWEERLLQGQAGIWLTAMWEVSRHETAALVVDVCGFRGCAYRYV